LQESFDEELYDRDFLEKKLEKSEKEDIIGSYFAPTTKRAAELLSQSSRLDANRVFNTWRGSVTFTDFARRNKPKSTEDHEGGRPGRPPNLSGSFNNLWLNEGTSRKPLRLEALPNIDSHRSRNQRLNSLDFL
jgi:hypothetical protein